MKRSIVTCLALMALLTLASEVQAVTIAIDIRNVKTNALLATGEESIDEVDGKVVREARYFDLAGKQVQTESCSYPVGGGRLESYSYRDPSTGEEVGIVAEGADHVRVSFREGSDRKEGLVKWTDASLHGKVIPERLLARWDELMAGKTITFDLLVASRLETIRFRGRYDAVASAKTQNPTFLVEADNVLIRIFAPDFRFVFDDPQNRQVVEYIGPSPIEIAGDRYPTVRLTFAEKRGAS